MYKALTEVFQNYGKIFSKGEKRIDKAYEEKDERLLRTLDKEMMAGINEYPLEYRRMIYKRIEAATGESAEKIEKAYFKKLEKILKRGVIRIEKNMSWCIVASTNWSIIHQKTTQPEKTSRSWNGSL